ncbi:MAG: RICIN domain-containing protein [Catenulispora sp.]
MFKIRRSIGLAAASAVAIAAATTGGAVAHAGAGAGAGAGTGANAGAAANPTTRLVVASQPQSSTAQPRSFVSPAFDADTYWLVSGLLCLDADYGTLHNKDTKVQMWACNAHEQQHWVFHAVSGKPYVYTITNVGGDNKCLDADTGTINRNGTIVHLWPCDSWVGQQWYIWSPDGYQLHLENEASGRYLDAATEKAGQNGDPVQLWDWNGGRASQTWQTLAP